MCTRVLGAINNCTTNASNIYSRLKGTETITRNSSGDEIANVNFLYDDIVHAVKIQ